MSTEPQTAEIIPQSQAVLVAPRQTAIESSIAIAVKARVEAATHARYTLAMNRPRHPDTVRQKIISECERPAFAEVARYRKPQGKKYNKETRKMEDVFVEGPSVRFVETAIRCFGNVMPEEHVIYDDANCRIIDVTITDLESNLTYQADVIVTKEIERSSGEGRTIISQRQNSYDKTVYTVVPTEDEMLTRQNALISKMRRNVGLRLLSRDLVDECMARVIAVQQKVDKADPDAARNKLFDQFAKLGIKALDIEEYLGHAVGWEDMATLRAIGEGIVQRDLTWADLMAEKRAGEAGEASRTLQEKMAAKAAKVVPKAEQQAETAEAPQAAAKARAAKPEQPAAAPAPSSPTPPDLFEYEVALTEAENEPQLKAARDSYHAAVKIGDPGRENLDRIWVGRKKALGID